MIKLFRNIYIFAIIIFFEESNEFSSSKDFEITLEIREHKIYFSHVAFPVFFPRYLFSMINIQGVQL